MRAFLPILTFAAATALVACGPQTTEGTAGRAGPTVTSGAADIGGPFTLVDETGAVVTEEAFKGQPTLVYFGFSYCPDVCPIALQKLGVAQAQMGDAADAVQFVLVSVDPERDTPEQLAVYVTNNGFPKGLRGFTGTVEQIDAMKAAYKVYAQKVPLEDSNMDYTVDHQDLVYLMGTDGQLASYYGPRQTPADIAVGVRQYLMANN
ncbi:photosynthetic protein synthase I [Algimonas arctica]|uniref:Photosynthetic protein synthase I n=1 Tax=Algimonas arctica TaxID=1479486 RepID=A0A8J3CRW3_9PROT|nr:SCO family protein [Algimonas arctica]GHA93010.1 photosynthetic protein synthase I [Algimonas arctica]